MSRRRVAAFEKAVRTRDGKDGYIDLLWKGVLLVEHKSRGKNLDRAYAQALDYFPGLEDAELPRYLLVSDFARFRLYDLDEDTQHEFPLEDLHKNINRFAFIAGYQTHKIEEQDPVNIKAAELMGKLHDQLRDIGYTGHDLEVYLVRLLFCMFAEDTGIFERQQFSDYIKDRTAEDGADLASCLDTLFYILNTSESQRLNNRDEQLAAFPYINGRLFEERLRPASFDRSMRESLLRCCTLDWSRISPAIFGSLFQSIMDKEARRNLGAHYTSEKNILKLINPLFMDDLRAEFEKVNKNKNRLFEFQKKLRALKFLDPACGCGNFLVIAYRELRLLELQILRATQKHGRQFLDIQTMLQLNVDQFYGIEIEEFPAQIAQVAMWLIDHQMNVLASEEFGVYFARIPLESGANIVHGNALRMDWSDVVAPAQLNYIMGNPPFVGKTFQSREQKSDLLSISENIKNSSDLDFVSGWYIKAEKLINGTDIRCAFVSTNSITQGEQVSILWGWLLEKGIEIFFAHRTFQWSNEARGKAAVHCVIIGFAAYSINSKSLFEYQSIQGESFRLGAKNINPYLVDAETVLIEKRRTPISKAPQMLYGNKPTDSGFYLFTDKERKEFVKKDPNSKKFFRKYIGAREFINSIPRYCLWLHNVSPSDLRKSPEVLKRIEKVRNFRLASTAKPTRLSANNPQDFFYISHSESNYLVVPETSSERREFIPIGYMGKNVIASNALWMIPNASKFDFAMLASSMHNAWMRTVGGRLKSDYRYAASIIYNNFPWPKNPTANQTANIETKAQAVLDARAGFPDSTLADLYDPLTMPSTLQKAHKALDKAVDRAYRKTAFNNEAARVAFLFDLYQQYTTPLLPGKKKRKRGKG